MLVVEHNNTKDSLVNDDNDKQFVETIHDIVNKKVREVMTSFIGKLNGLLKGYDSSSSVENDNELFNLKLNTRKMLYF